LIGSLKTNAEKINADPNEIPENNFPNNFLAAHESVADVY
jgi:hypothetical protein